jgi:hypothetical protein
MPLARSWGVTWLLVTALYLSPSPRLRGEGWGEGNQAQNAPTKGPQPLVADFTSPARLESDWTLDGSGVWAIRGGVLALEKAGTPAGPIRRPSALAILRATPLRDLTVDLELRSTAPPIEQVPRRDALVIVGYESPTRFYYVHISAARDAVHNGIFLVDGADRRRIDTQSEKAILVDAAWHRVRVIREPASGRLDVYADDQPAPIMSARDSTIASGRVGVGSFDDTAEFRSVRVEGRVATGDRDR